MKQINYEVAQRFNISADHWIIFISDKKVFYDFVAFCNQRGLILPYGTEWQESHYKVFKVPVDKKDKYVGRGGNITIMGPVYRAIGIIYDPYQFMKDYVEDE